MSKEEDFFEDIKAHFEILKISRESEEKKIPTLKRRRFFLDRLVLKRGGVFGYIIPILLAVVLFAVGFYAGIFSVEIEPLAQASYIFWILFILFGTYLLNWLVYAIMEVIEEANQKVEIPETKHNRIINLMFGFVGLVMSVLIALPFILYDITGFGNPEEGWLVDIQYYYETGDNSWYPRITETENGIGFGSILWLIIWIIPWLYFGAFVWLSTVLVFYINVTLKNADYRDRIQKVIREKQYSRLLKLSIAAYAPVGMYLVIKLVYQFFYEIWWSDTIATYVLFGIFIFGVVFSPFLVTRDVKVEKKELLHKLRVTGDNFFDNTVIKVFQGKDIDNKTLMKAMLLHMHNNDLVNALTERVVDRSLMRKMVIAIVAPVASFLIRIILPLLPAMGI